MYTFIRLHFSSPNFRACKMLLKDSRNFCDQIRGIQRLLRIYPNGAIFRNNSFAFRRNSCTRSIKPDIIFMPKKALDKKSIPQGKYTNISKIHVFSFVFSLRTKKLKTKTKNTKKWTAFWKSNAFIAKFLKVSLWSKAKLAI